MARTAPTIDGTANYIELSIRFIDDSGDKRSVSLRVDAAATNADIEGAIVALGNATSANIYRVDRSEVYATIPDASLAIDGEQNSVYDQVSILYQTVDGLSQRVVIPAPVEGLMDGDTDNVNTGAALYIGVRDEFEDILPAAYEPVHTRYTERRETNKPKLPA